jgi:DNA-binding SARP family transcriptional activator
MPTYGRADGDATLTAQRADFRVLGPLQLLVNGIPQPLGGKNQRAVLAMLVLNRNRVVSADALADAAWNGEPPSDFKNNLQVAVSKVRRSISAAGLDAQLMLPASKPGYRLVIADEDCDLGRFEALRSEGVRCAAARRYDEASRTFAAALALSTGDALADLNEFAFAAEFAREVDEDVFNVSIDWARAEMHCGRAQNTIDTLRQLTRKDPYHDPLCVELMTALYLSGRQKDALDAAARLRRALVEDLGIDPSPAVRELEQTILAQEPIPLAASPAPQTGLDATVIHGEIPNAQLRDPDNRCIPIRPGTLRLGRAVDNHVVVDRPDVSRNHAAIVNTGVGFVLKDLHSSNGTYVNGRRALEPETLADGDVIGIGRTEFVFELLSSTFRTTARRVASEPPGRPG